LATGKFEKRRRKTQTEGSLKALPGMGLTDRSKSRKKKGENILRPWGKAIGGSKAHQVRK